ncbi:hypothetical protein OIO90_001248 [Microbotryomycetes sp. JL221]|nr:hypothetical protein OIO90_001248 [Microbotryomycetes sp. JL221]
MSGSAFKSWSRTSPGEPFKQVDVTAPGPEQLGPHEMLVENRAAALNPVDTQLSNMGLFKLSSLAHPKGVAADFAGVVLAVGKQVSGFKQGDHVFGMQFQAMPKPAYGALSQVMIVDTKTSQVVIKPQHLSWQQAASLPLVWQTAATLLAEPNTILPPNIATPTIVVLGGSSSVGMHVVQIAKSKLGAKVVATCSSRNSEFVKADLGADIVIDYTSEDILSRLLDLRPDEGYTCIIDCVGGTELLSSLNQLLIKRTQEFPQGGCYLTIVGDKTDRSVLGGATIYMWHPWMLLRYYKGRFGFGPRYACIDLERRTTFLEDAIQLTKQGNFKIAIDSVFGFDDVLKAFDKLNSGRARGKVIVNIKDD